MVGTLVEVHSLSSRWGQPCVGDKWLASNACDRATTDRALNALSGASATPVDFSGRRWRDVRLLLRTSWLLVCLYPWRQFCPSEVESIERVFLQIYSWRTSFSYLILSLAQWSGIFLTKWIELLSERSPQTKTETRGVCASQERPCGALCLLHAPQ